MRVTADFSGAADPLELILGPEDETKAFALGLPSKFSKSGRNPKWFDNTTEGRNKARDYARDNPNIFLCTTIFAERAERFTQELLIPARAHVLQIDLDSGTPKDPELWRKLRRKGAVLTYSGGRADNGRRKVHLRILLAEPITDPVLLGAWNKHLARLLGADERVWWFNAWLSAPGTLRVKDTHPQGRPVRVVDIAEGAWTLDELQRLCGAPEMATARTFHDIPHDLPEVPQWARDLMPAAVAARPYRHSQCASLAGRIKHREPDRPELAVSALLEFEPLQEKCADEGTDPVEFARARVAYVWAEKEKTPDASHTEGSRKESNMATDPITSDDTGLGVLDLMALRKNPPPPPVFLEAGLFQEGVGTKITAASGSGKTILLADLAWHWSLGYCALSDEKLVRPRKILYVDGEVGQPWWIEYLGKFDAPLETPNLNVIAFPEWAPLDTDAGALSFWNAVEAVEPDAVFLDTLSAFIEGEENDASTYAAFDRRITLPLIRRGITFISSDHTGKDASRGSRGSSAKMSKLWAEWQMSADPNDPNALVLKCSKDRSGIHRKGVELPLTRWDSPLRHSLDPAPDVSAATGVRREARPGAPRITDATLERRLVGTLAAFPNASRNKILSETTGERARLLPILERLLDGS
ncbi:AAA family ATPase [Nocardia flavorosea]|uniref:AAA family ATPase n=1 Tax=Nocardia flavorosea TaxID=53429 RepID=UPI002455F0F9|nr:AAA family ATPase [Nocardia flavorosea]